MNNLALNIVQKVALFKKIKVLQCHRVHQLLRLSITSVYSIVGLTIGWGRADALYDALGIEWRLRAAFDTKRVHNMFF